MNKQILKSAADAAAHGLFWRFVWDGGPFGIFHDVDLTQPLEAAYDDDGDILGWLLDA